MKIKTIQNIKENIKLTSFSIISSVLITYFILYFVFKIEENSSIYNIGLFISIIAPLLIAPVVVFILQKVKNKLYLKNIKLRNIRRYDTLTKLYNRRYFNHLLTKEINLAYKNNSYFSIIIINYNQFKKLNEKFSYDIADDILKLIAKIIKSNISLTDICARYGDDEFIILCSSTNIENLIIQLNKQINRKLKINNSEINISTSIYSVIYSKNIHKNNIHTLISTTYKNKILSQ